MSLVTVRTRHLFIDRLIRGLSPLERSFHGDRSLSLPVASAVPGRVLAYVPRWAPFAEKQNQVAASNLPNVRMPGTCPRPLPSAPLPCPS